LLSTIVGVRVRLWGKVGGSIKSMSLTGDLALEADAGADEGASSSTSVSRVTMIGVRGRTEERRPKVKSFVSGYNGIGETRTVRSVMVVGR